MFDNRFSRIYDPNASRTAKALQANLNRRAFGFYMPVDAVFAKSGIWGIKQKRKKRHPFKIKLKTRLTAFVSIRCRTGKFKIIPKKSKKLVFSCCGTDVTCEKTRHIYYFLQEKHIANRLERRYNKSGRGVGSVVESRCQSQAKRST